MTFDLDVAEPANVIDDLLRHVPVMEAHKIALRNAMMGPTRLYHGLYHYATMWWAHHRLKARFAPPYLTRDGDREIASAILYHDIIYDARSSRNEAASAELWRSHAAAAGAAAVIDIDLVEAMILATAQHFANRPYDTEADRRREWFVGLDLVSLAAEPAQFDLNTALIRLEYAHLSNAEWAAGRGSFLRMVGQVPRIFRDPVLHDLFEAKARANIGRSLASPEGAR